MLKLELVYIAISISGVNKSKHKLSGIVYKH